MSNAVVKWSRIRRMSNLLQHLFCWASQCPDPFCRDPASTLLIRSVEGKAVGFGGIILWSLAYCLWMCCCNQSYTHRRWAVNLNSHAVMLGNSCTCYPLITGLTSNIHEGLVACIIQMLPDQLWQQISYTWSFELVQPILVKFCSVSILKLRSSLFCLTTDFTQAQISDVYV